MPSFRVSAAALGLSTAFALLAPGALAVEAEVFGERLQALAESQGADLQWSDISVDGDAVTLSGATLGAPGEEERIELGEVTFEDVTEEYGGYRIGLVSIPSYSFEDDDASAVAEGLTITGLIVPEEGSDAAGGLMMYDTAALDSLTVTADGAEVLTLSGLSAEIDAAGEDAPVAISASVEEFTADLSQAEDAKAREAVEALGYSTISGSMEMAAQWNPADGRATLEQLEISVADAGTLGISVDLGGYTPELAKAVQELQANMATASDEEKSAQGLAMFGLMQQMTFHGATITFEDDSMTGKVLDHVAAEQNMERNDIANLATAVLPLYLAQLDNPEFSEQVTAAVSAFLENPGSFTISAEPADPVPFALLFAGAMTAPQSLVEQLGVTVTANGGE
jgi:hypothetical protein